jgi:hypothetical protein
MTDTMRERVARAIAESHYPDKCVESMWQHMMPDAIAAIEAMREPTEAMVNAGYDVGYSPDPLPCDAVWKAMIDAAISEGKE